MKLFRWLHQFNFNRKKTKNESFIHHINGSNGLETKNGTRKWSVNGKSNSSTPTNQKSTNFLRRSFSLKLRKTNKVKKYKNETSNLTNNHHYSDDHICDYSNSNHNVVPNGLEKQNSFDRGTKRTLSLRRIGSFGSRLLPKKKNDNNLSVTNTTNSGQIRNDEDGGESSFVITSEDQKKIQKTSFCIFTENYQQLTIDNNGKNITEIDQHPKFIKYSKLRNETLFVSKKCLKCNENGSMCIIQSLNNILFKQLMLYYRINQDNEQLEKIAFYLDGQNCCLEPIKNEISAEFSQTFGSSLKEFKFLTKYKDLCSGERSFNNNITATFLPILYVNSEHFTNLVDFEILISDKAIAKIFSFCFISSYGKQLESLAIKFRSEMTNFHTLIADVIDSISKSMKKLKYLRIELLPVSLLNDNSIELSETLNIIADLANFLKSIQEFSLAVDVNYVQLGNLNLIGCLSAFKQANSLSLMLYSDNQRSNLADFDWNFDLLFNNVNLRKLYIDSLNILNEDVENLVKNCPNLIELNLRCDYFIDQISINAIIKHSSNLQTLSIGQAFSYQDNKYGLYIDNTALNMLLSDAPKRMPFLRKIKLANCRISFEEKHQSLIDNLRMFALSKPDETFKFVLENNRFSLIDEDVFRCRYEIPANMDLEWIHKRKKQETQL